MSSWVGGIFAYIEVPRLQNGKISKTEFFLQVDNIHRLEITYFTSPFFSRSISRWMPSVEARRVRMVTHHCGARLIARLD